MYRRAICVIGSAILVVATLATAQARDNSGTTGPDAPCPASEDPRQKPEPELPNAPSYSAPLTSRQKFDTFAKRTYSPYTFASAAIAASWAQMWGDHPSYGDGIGGWGKRFGASVANSEARLFFNSFLLPVVFQQDPRYFSSSKKGFFPRAGYAASCVLVGRSDKGNKMFNYSEVLGVLFISSLQNSYYPRDERGFSDTMSRFAGGLATDASACALKEFSPELKRAARKIIPKKAQKLEKKIPGPVRQIDVPLP